MTPHEFLLFFWHEKGWVGRKKKKENKKLKSTSENGFWLVKILFNLVT